MKNARPASMQLAICLLLSLASHADPAMAQAKMNAEQEAIYRKMMKSAGVDPDTGMDAVRKNESSQQWTQGKGGVVDYHIVGVYQARTNVVGDPNWIGYADVMDRVVIQLQWHLAEAKLIGKPNFQNTKSDVKNPRNAEPSCRPPILKGEYEHFELQEVRQVLGGALVLQAQTSYPAVDVVQSCTGSLKSIPASRKARTDEMVVPSPAALEMKWPDSDHLRVSADKKSLIHKKDGWTWTFTPSVNK